MALSDDPDRHQYHLISTCCVTVPPGDPEDRAGTRHLPLPSGGCGRRGYAAGSEAPCLGQRVVCHVTPPPCRLRASIVTPSVTPRTGRLPAAVPGSQCCGVAVCHPTRPDRVPAATPGGQVPAAPGTREAAPSAVTGLCAVSGLDGSGVCQSSFLGGVTGRGIPRRAHRTGQAPVLQDSVFVGREPPRCPARPPARLGVMVCH